jgi:hypothetical protein
VSGKLHLVQTHEGLVTKECTVGSNTVVKADRM